MIINLYKHRFIIALIIILLACIPLLCKFVTIPNAREKELAHPQKIKQPVYGEFLKWEEAEQLFPRQSCATVIDFDTKVRFRVQRRGGSSHADVQPLTAEDTRKMKSIYNGQWSWKRKAIIVELGSGRKIAASMNGMPHGQGVIRGNNFNGHFCIHFKDSKTHGSKSWDLAHQMMIWKSANVLDQQLTTLSPERIIGLFITAINQGEIKIARKLINSSQDFGPYFKNVKYMQADRIEKIKQNTYRVDVRVVLLNSSDEIKKKLIVTMSKKSKPYWQINSVFK